MNNLNLGKGTALFFLLAFRLGKSNSLVSSVKNGIESADKNISKDPEGPIRGRDVESHESGEAGSLAVVVQLEDVVLSLENEVLSADGVGNRRELVNSAAEDFILSVSDGNSSDELLDLLDLSGRSSKEGSSSVDDGIDYSSNLKISSSNYSITCIPGWC